MEKWLMIVETNCADPSKEDEFNKWYDNAHLADLLSLPGVTRAVRYENPNAVEGQAKFMALYDLETEDILGFMQALSQGMDEWAQEGRISPLLRIASACFYRMITPPKTL